MKTKSMNIRALPADVIPPGETIGEVVARQTELILSTLHTQQRKGDAILGMASSVMARLNALRRAQMRLEEALYSDYLRDEYPTVD